jgi:hypothetical protein
MRVYVGAQLRSPIKGQGSTRRRSNLQDSVTGSQVAIPVTESVTTDTAKTLHESGIEGQKRDHGRVGLQADSSGSQFALLHSLRQLSCINLYREILRF